MQYSVLGKTGLKVSRLGFGCMRLPMSGTHVDRDRAVPLLQLACDLGINYFDTAIFYCSEDSQRALGEALEGRRQEIVLSTKNHLYTAGKPGEWRRRLEESLQLLRTGYLDIYNFHGLNLATFNEAVRPPAGLYREMERARDEGLIRHICCSVHDEPGNLVQLAETGLFASFTVQYNLIDRSNEAAIRKLSELGCGVVIMGPVAGGRLGDRMLPQLNMPAAAVALRFVLSNPAVNIALSGMENEAMLRQNVETVESLQNEEGQPQQTGDTGEAVSAFFARMRKYYCTACRYCLPCPHGVAIPENMTLLINDEVFGLTGLSRNQYAKMTASARRCTGCKLCLSKCPQKLEINSLMARAVERFDPDYGRIAVDVQIDQPPSARSSADSRSVFFPATISLTNLTGAALKAQPVTLSANGTPQVWLEYSAGPGTTRRYQAGIQVMPDDHSEVRFSVAADQSVCTRRFIVVSPADSEPLWNRIDSTSRFQIGNAELFEGHSMQFAFQADAEHLIFLARVTDDCLRCAEQTPALVLSDCVELYLSPGTGGTMHGLFLFPGTKAGSPAFIKTTNMPLIETELLLASRFTPTGYELKLSVPFASLGIRPGDFLKADAVLNSADAQGKRILAVEFAHAPDYWTSPAGHAFAAW